jgi:hypothetical protein
MLNCDQWRMEEQNKKTDNVEVVFEFEKEPKWIGGDIVL